GPSRTGACHMAGCGEGSAGFDAPHAPRAMRVRMGTRLASVPRMFSASPRRRREQVWCHEETTVSPRPSVEGPGGRASIAEHVSSNRTHRGTSLLRARRSLPRHDGLFRRLARKWTAALYRGATAVG